jgi:hypothetical protein
MSTGHSPLNLKFLISNLISNVLFVHALAKVFGLYAKLNGLVSVKQKQPIGVIIGLNNKAKKNTQKM